MLKENKWKLIISSVVILLPMLLGLLLWNTLPEQFATHWGLNGEADGWQGKAFAVFVIPCSILVLHWLCIAVTALDKKNKGQNAKVMGLIFWIAPATSLYANGVVYATAMGMEISIDLVTFALIGLMFVAIGNYLPKCKQNQTIGFKVTWTLNDEENWNKTHRLCGKVWVIGGLILMVSIFLPGFVQKIIIPIVLLALVLVPILYSYGIYRKKVKSGESIATKAGSADKAASLSTRIALIITAVVLILVVVTFTTGDVKLQFGDSSFHIDATYWSDLTVDYAAIESIEYREEHDAGSRESGFGGGTRIELGLFENSEFGRYTRYCYTGCEACVVLKVDGKTLVVNGENAEDTEKIYEELLRRTGK